ncbi:MAG: DNA-binding protein [Oscillospiraceae bacterium]|nr:DNA-binding protein [Oscillospiraceae bacterium]
MSLLENMTIDDLDAEQRALAECIGMDAYKNLLENYAGSCIYVRTPDRVTNRIRNECIREKFNGYNYTELAKEFDLSVVTIRRILRKTGKAKSPSLSPPERKL